MNKDEKILDDIHRIRKELSASNERLSPTERVEKTNARLADFSKKYGFKICAK